MMRIWTGVGLLSASWLFGLGLYRSENWFLWAACLASAVLLMKPQTARTPSTARGCTALILFALFLPAIWFFPWPYKAVPLFLAAGAGLAAAPIRQCWPGRLGRAAVACGAVIAAQAAAVWAYAGLTARSHDLPWVVVSLMAAAARLTGADVSALGGGVNNSALAVRAAGNIHQLTATWDMFFDPASLCFLVGGWAVLALLKGDNDTSRVHLDAPQTSGDTGSGASRRTLRDAAILALIVLAWLPLRAALLIAIYVVRAELADAAWPLTVMEQFLSPWPSLVFLIVPLLLAERFVPLKNYDVPLSPSTLAPRRYALALALTAATAAVLCAIWTWDPAGSPKQGRVAVVEKHSLWEPTDKPYDKVSYGEPASYTYGLIYDYCSHYLQMLRLTESDAIDAKTLDACDVLILKTPTARFSAKEVDAIRRYVQRGGGLLLIGDHTNVFNSSTYLNDIARQFGFTFANDLLFRVGDPYQQPYRAAAVPHPIVCNLDEMDFAVSCSIDPGASLGQAVIQSTGLWSIPPEYSYPNFHPPAHYLPEMRAGSFIQLWATRYGSGRVAAFTDSTIFSNFCIFQPGKTELFLGMLDWLNRSSTLDKRWNRVALSAPFALAGILMLIAAVRLTRREPGAWLCLLAAGMFGLAISGAAATALHRRDMAWPQPNSPPPMIVIDREVSDASLSKGAFAFGPGEHFGLLEQWIPRIGFFTKRCAGADATSGDGLVVICPSKSVSPEYRRRLIEYVENGGRLLVFDSPGNAGSTANSLLWAFGLSLGTDRPPLGGKLTLPDGKPWNKQEIAAAWTVSGGRPLAAIGGNAAAAQIRYGRGTVTAVGFASAFNDAAMGDHWMQPPDEDMLERYNLLFALLEAAFKDNTPDTK